MVVKMGNAMKMGCRLATAALLTAVSADAATVRPAATQEALINPGMGLVCYHNAGRFWAYGSKTAPGDTLDWFPGVSTIYFRLLWSDLEPREGEYHWEIIDSFAQPWIARGKKLALRIICSNQTTNAVPDYVRAAGAKGAWFDYPPEDWRRTPVLSRFWEPVFDDPVFLEKYEAFMRAFAARYDGDESVAFVDIGSIGLYGEGHTYGTVKLNEADTERINLIHYDLHRRVLPRTQLIVSHSAAHPAIFKGMKDTPLLAKARELGIGFRNDSVFCYGYRKPPCSWTDGCWARLFAPTLPVVIETGHYSMTQANGQWHSDRLVPCAEAFQASYFSIHGFPDRMWKELRPEYEELARRIGYRFELREASWPDEVRVGEPVEIRAEWVNVGVAWCHEPAFAAWTLTDAKDNVVWTCVDERFDFREAYPKIDGIPTWDLTTPGPRVEGREHPVSRASVCRFGFDAVTMTNDIVYIQTKELGYGPPDAWQMLKRGEYDLSVSVGSRQGTPRIALPLEGQIGTTRRYRLGKVRVK